jgi:hypothetical protein
VAEPDRDDPMPSRLRVVFVLVLAAVIGAHVVLVTAAALPPNRYSEAARPATAYLSPYFTQNWRLFAPRPVSSDRSVLFQAAFRVEGEVRSTGWVDWTDVELDLVRHQLVGGRAGYVTNKMYSPLSSRYRALTDEQAEAIAVDDPERTPGWAELERDVADLAQGPVQVANVERWLRYERAVTALGSAVWLAREPDAELVAVRYSIRSQGVTPYADRTGDVVEREAARPTPTERINGWREPIRPDDAELEAVREFDGRHR